MSAMSELHLERQEWADNIAKHLGQPVTIVDLDDPCTWQLELTDGLTVTRTVRHSSASVTINPPTK